MGTSKIYRNFSEIKSEIEKIAPPIIYKYRSWDTLLHREIITQNALWFSHPFDLNDPFDLRPPLQFVLDISDEKGYINKLYEFGMYYGYAGKELDTLVEEKWNEIKKDPENYFRNNRNELFNDRSAFESIGVLSLSENGLNPSLWANYANSQYGFAIGFHTLNLCEVLECHFGKVEYSDTPILYNPLISKIGDTDWLFQKSAVWSSEEELRYITHAINNGRNRKFIFPNGVVAEILLGNKMSQNDKEDIVKNVKNVWGSEIPIFTVETSPNSFQLQKSTNLI